MDFLDPKLRRRHQIRLYIGYALMAFVILLTSSILVFSAYGFDVDRKTGEVIQNGLLFVDSAPDDAQVVLNDQIQKDRTNNRFSVPAGDYSLKIQKQDYRVWNRSFAITGGEVERFTYPMLILNTLKPVEVAAYDAPPTLVTQSPDRRWNIVNQGNSLTNFTEYDLNTINDQTGAPQSRTFTVPNSTYTQAEGAHSIELVEWSTDNKHFLIKHTFATGFEYIVVSRDQPTTSVNVNQLLGVAPTNVTLRDKKFDQWYIFTQTGGLLQTADAKKMIKEVAKDVTAYKSHDDNTVLYATPSKDGKTQQVMLKQDDKTYRIRDIAPGVTQLDIARYDGKWQVVVGSDGDHKAYVYTDPVEMMNSNDGRPAAPAAVLKANGPLSWVGFSQNARFMVAQSGQHFEVYDAEYKQYFQYDIKQPFDAGTKVDWIDGHRMVARSNGQAIIYDFDGSNQQTLLPTLPTAPLVFDRDYTVLYTFDASKTTAGKTAFNSTQLRLDTDK